jgi:predicted RNase H-like nuclease (RuvC/YqgF family)
MQRMFLKVFAIALFVNSAAYGQSLGDIARENREKQSAQDASSTAKPKVITNANLPKDPDAKQEPTEAQSGASVSNKAADHRLADDRSAQQRLADQRLADQWKRQILAQENRMATLQARIDQLNASIRSAGGSVQYEGPYNRYQARQLRRVAQIQAQLDEQKMKLDQMQEAARRAGMHTAVYDP